MPTVRANQLDGFATVPHCLDNHFLPFNVLSALHRRKIGGAQVAKSREKAVRREYVRSLLYSPEVVINRAFALNEPAVFQDVSKDPESMAKLAERNISILMFRDEPSLSEVIKHPPFKISRGGEKAWQKYLSVFGEDQIRVLRLSDRDSMALPGRFDTFIRRLIRREFLDGQMDELFSAVSPEGTHDSMLSDFEAFLESEGEPWLRTQGNTIKRGAYYAKFVLPDGADVEKPDIDRCKRFSYQMKLLGDLAYNHNLPTTLHRQSFMAMQMPSPLCLPPDLFSHTPEEAHVDGDAAIDVCDRTLVDPAWYYRSQEAFLLPEWADLTIADVCEMQSWPEWINFREAQRAVSNVSSPDRFDASLAALFGALEGFQNRLSREISQEAGSLKHLRVGATALKLLVRPLITWAGQIITPGVAGHILANFAMVGIDYAIDVGIEFFEERKDSEHEIAVQGFVYKASGLRQNVLADIREHSDEDRRRLEQMAAETEVPYREVTAQRA